MADEVTTSAPAPSSAPSAPASAPSSAPSSTPSAPATSTPAAPEEASFTPDPSEGFSEAEKLDAAKTDELQAVWDKLHPPRDPASQRFVAKDGKEVAESAEGTEVPAVKPPEVPATPPPQAWTAEAKAKWDAIPAELQPYVAQREKAAHKVITEYGQKIKEFQQYHSDVYKPFDQIIEGYKDTFQRKGIAPAQAFAVLMDAQRQLDGNPVEGLVKIGMSYGIDLRPAFQGYQVQHAPLTQQQQLQQMQEHPFVIQQQQKIAQLEARLDTREQREVAAQDNEILRHIGSFQSAKDKDGTPLRPYFDQAKPIMAMFLEKGAAKNLEQAYDMAVHATPTLRQRIQADQRKAEEAKRTAEAKLQAGNARRANSVNVKSAIADGSTPKTMDDTLNEIAMKHYGRIA